MESRWKSNETARQIFIRNYFKYTFSDKSGPVKVKDEEIQHRSTDIACIENFNFKHGKTVGTPKCKRLDEKALGRPGKRRKLTFGQTNNCKHNTFTDKF